MKNIYKYSVFCGSLVLASCNNEDKDKQGQNSKKEKEKEKDKKPGEKKEEEKKEGEKEKQVAEKEKKDKEAAAEKEKKDKEAAEKVEEIKQQIKKLQEQAYELDKEKISKYVDFLAKGVKVLFEEIDNSVVVKFENLNHHEINETTQQLIEQEINGFYKGDHEFYKKFVDKNKHVTVTKCEDTSKLVSFIEQILDLKKSLNYK